VGDEGTGTTARTVLVVEDDPAVLDLLDEALTEEGYRVERAQDGVAALEVVQRERPDLVVADAHMPRLDGGQLMRRLREREIPAILLSGDPNWAHVPGVAFVPKPFDLDHLLTIVARLLERSSR
jgi:CheY-like chemotaxis protein